MSVVLQAQSLENLSLSVLEGVILHTEMCISASGNEGTRITSTVSVTNELQLLSLIVCVVLDKLSSRQSLDDCIFR